MAVAHDFNNLLTGILGNASLALSGFSPHHPDRILIEEVVKAAERASDLTRQLLAYAGKGRFVMRTVNLSDLVREISGLVQASIPKNAQLRLQLEHDIPGIDADPGQLQQIIMNLVINGAEAIGPDGGTVLVRPALQEVDEPYIATFSTAGDVLRPGRYVSLQVHDNGAGMNEATRRKIFDPFFTTKFAGRGLGLSAVLGIVRSHRGALKVYSEPGTRHHVPGDFPGLAEPGATEAGAAERIAPGRPGQILVVDDEEIVRESCAEHTRTIRLPDGGRRRRGVGDRGVPHGNGCHQRGAVGYDDAGNQRRGDAAPDTVDQPGGFAYCLPADTTRPMRSRVRRQRVGGLHSEALYGGGSRA